MKNALYLLEIHRRDEAVTDPNLFKLVTGRLVVRPRKPQQDQILVAGSQLANQAKHLVVGSIRSFQIENKGLKRDLVEKWQYLFAGAQKRGVEGGRQHFLRRQLHRFVRGHNRDARGRARGYRIHRHRKRPRNCQPHEARAGMNYR